MTEYNEGDLVEAVKGETRLASRVGSYGSQPGLVGLGWTIENLLTDGFTITVIEKAKPKLPTEPGDYAMRTDGANHVFTLDTYAGLWWDGSVVISEEELLRRHARREAPLVKLEPAAETAKKVLDAVEGWVFGPGPSNEEIGDLTARLRKEFGATA